MCGDPYNTFPTICQNSINPKKSVILSQARWNQYQYEIPFKHRSEERSSRNESYKRALA